MKEVIKEINTPSTFTVTVSLLSDVNTLSFPLLTSQWYDPESLLFTESILKLFLYSWSGLPSLYHWYSHPEETVMWQQKETESSVCIKLCSGCCVSVTVGLASEKWTQLKRSYITVRVVLFKKKIIHWNLQYFGLFFKEAASFNKADFQKQHGYI